MTFISKKFEQFTYFALQLKEHNWAGKDVLDFGGNIGNIMLDPNSSIEEERYWCIDVDKKAVQQGKVSFPDSHWIFYNRHSYYFNPNGIPNLKIPIIGQQFDFIVAYSVFSNTSRADMLDLVEQLVLFLKPGGKLAFTFVDPNYSSMDINKTNLQWRIERGETLENSSALLKLADAANWCTLVNDKKLYIDNEDINMTLEEQKSSYYTYYVPEYLKQLFPLSTILPPVNNESQHCCIITRPEKI